ncbi:hypothetical protein NE237_004147 [Protea cynaroides]|uniref:Uncharacterized protein n=1 Tax=Protea cynaroides TaxID=273540 RepID=A0A9Q0KI45_9MAGN|nr:hypothetical protein NE237_004147 [Protea cynaroides]
MKPVHVPDWSVSDQEGRTNYAPEELVRVNNKPIGAWADVEEEADVEDEIESGNEEGEFIGTPITENARMTPDNMEENRVMEDQRDVDVSTAQNVEGVLPAGVNQSVPIRTVTSSPGGSAMIGELGQVEVEFDDVSAVDTFLSDNGGAYTVVEKRKQGRIGRGGKKTDQSTTHEGTVRGSRKVDQMGAQEAHLARLETLRKKVSNEVEEVSNGPSGNDVDVVTFGSSESNQVSRSVKDLVILAMATNWFWPLGRALGQMEGMPQAMGNGSPLLHVEIGAGLAVPIYVSSADLR